MKVAFLTNHISYGGTEVSMYDYAHFNEVLLGNTSIVLTRDYRATHGEIYAKFEKRFPVLYITSREDINAVVRREGVDVLYVQKSGEVDWFGTDACPSIVHAVFTTRFPHGTLYAAISSSLNTLHRTRVPVLPYMVYLEDTDETFREELGIPKDAIVLGRHGSYDSFDIPFVHSTLLALLERMPSLHVVVMNTKPFGEHPRLHSLPRTTDLRVKRKFINTCTVMIHARARGETFGLACGEFAISGKPILTYGGSPERAHLDILGPKALVYTSVESLWTLVESQAWKRVDMSQNGYMQYKPEPVMGVFRQCLDHCVRLQ
jgi:hypothetical protein